MLGAAESLRWRHHGCGHCASMACGRVVRVGHLVARGSQVASEMLVLPTRTMGRDTPEVPVQGHKPWVYERLGYPERGTEAFGNRLQQGGVTEAHLPSQYTERLRQEDHKSEVSQGSGELLSKKKVGLEM